MLTVEEYCKNLKTILTRYKDNLALGLNFDTDLKSYNPEDFIAEAQKQGFTIKHAKDIKSKYFHRKYGKSKSYFAFLNEDSI